MKLPAEERSKLLELEGAKQFEPMPGRVMGEYVVLPDSILDSESQLREWLATSFKYVKSLPPKKRKKRGEKASQR